MPGKKNCLSLPHYYPTGSLLLKEVKGAALRHMNDMCSTGRSSQSFFWLWNTIQKALQEHGLYADVLLPAKTFGHLQDAPRSTEGRRKIIFKQDSAQALAEEASNAMGMEQAAIFFRHSHVIICTTMLIAQWVS